MKKIFIIGGGIAALEAAKSARSTQRDALIVLISAENALPYSRPMLTKQLMGKVTAQDLAVESAAWYDEKDIVVLTGRTVTAIDPVGKTLVAGGIPFHWDSLILATGASCFVPPIPGADGANVVAVRTFEDVARVREIAKTAKNAAVIGGGVLGLEAASSLAEAGLSVTVLEHGDQLMKRQIDAQAAQHLESAMAGKGVKLLKSADSARIDASGVTLVDGTRIPAELVIVSAGVRANIRLAKDAGIAAERHIAVDDHMRTNLPDVYAAGDCASTRISRPVVPCRRTMPPSVLPSQAYDYRRIVSEHYFVPHPHSRHPVSARSPRGIVPSAAPLLLSSPRSPSSSHRTMSAPSMSAHSMSAPVLRSVPPGWYAPPRYPYRL